jgi:hypothetical protein
MNESIPRDQLGGTPTSARQAATPFNVVMTVALLIALPPFVYYLWVCLAFNFIYLDHDTGQLSTILGYPTHQLK